jgi:hypothetical protein
MNDKILGLIRHVLTFVGGIIVAKGLAESSLTEEIIGGILTVVGGVWSVISKKK